MGESRGRGLVWSSAGVGGAPGQAGQCGRGGPRSRPSWRPRRPAPLPALGRALASAAARPTLAGALDDLAEAARVVSGADLALVRVPAGESLRAVAVSGPSALAAELEGTRLAAADLPPATVAELAEAPE